MMHKFIKHLIGTLVSAIKRFTCRPVICSKCDSVFVEFGRHSETCVSGVFCDVIKIFYVKSQFVSFSRRNFVEVVIACNVEIIVRHIWG